MGSAVCCVYLWMSFCYDDDDGNDAEYYKEWEKNDSSYYDEVWCFVDVRAGRERRSFAALSISFYDETQKILKTRQRWQFFFLLPSPD